MVQTVLSNTVDRFFFLYHIPAILLFKNLELLSAYSEIKCIIFNLSFYIFKSLVLDHLYCFYFKKFFYWMFYWSKICEKNYENIKNMKKKITLHCNSMKKYHHAYLLPVLFLWMVCKIYHHVDSIFLFSCTLYCFLRKAFLSEEYHSICNHKLSQNTQTFLYFLNFQITFSQNYIAC